MKKLAILIVNYVEFDFLVKPLLELVEHFWLDHPSIFITGTNKQFNGSETIIFHETFSATDWVFNYYESLKIIQQSL